MLSNRFLHGVSLAQPIGYVGECARSTMFEHAETASEHPGWQPHPAAGQSLEQLARVFSSMRNIPNPHGIGPMDLDKGWEPIRFISHRTDLCGLGQLASAGLDFRHVGKVGRIDQAREVFKWQVYGLPPMRLL